MPELPEVETVARTLAPQVCGRRIDAVTVLNAGSWQGAARPESVSAGHFVITGTGRRGKLLLLYLSREADVLPASHPETEIPAPERASCWPLCYTARGAERGRPSLDGKEPGDITALAFHLRMTGRLFVYPAGTEPEKHTRVMFTLDDGSGTPRQILSGIAQFYKPEELIGKTLMAIVNLPPRKMMGLESNGMLISAVHTEHGEEKLHLLMLDDSIPAGAKLC